MGFRDYRLDYTRAIVYLHLEKDYERGLKAINKSLALYQANPFVYSVKNELLRKLHQPDEQELQALTAEYTSKWRTRSYRDMSAFFKAMED